MPKAKPKIFISHAWEDKELVRQLEKVLRAAGAEVWVDHAELRGGQNLPKRISNALEWCNTLLLIWSKAAADSRWVELEWTNALSLGKVIVPCRRDRIALPAIMANTLFLDFKDPQKGVAELLHALELAQKPKRTPATAPTHPIAQAIQDKLAAEKPAAKPKPPQTEPLQSLRNRPMRLSGSDVKEMLRKYLFYCGEYSWSKEYANPNGKGIIHDYKLQMNGKIVYDAATGLTWQKAGSDEFMRYDKTLSYVEKLNQERFAGYNDWRLPTLEEAMSLMQPKENEEGLYIDPIFDSRQKRIWTADKGASGAWLVDFFGGLCNWYNLLNDYHVRAVR